MISFSELANLLAKENKLALICHVRPDGDTLGSALGLKLSLESLGKCVEVFCEDAVPERFSFLNESALVRSDLPSMSEFSALVAIDCAEITRLGVYANSFLAHSNTYSIDHHVSNTRFAKTNFVLDNASNCENVFRLVKEMKINVSERIANLLAVGLVTDTGAFKHKNVTSETFEVASELLSKGADFNAIIYHNFNKQSKSRAKLFGLVMSKIRYFYDDRLALICITKRDIEACGAKADETEGFIDFIMGVDSVEIGVSLLEIGVNNYKVSFRSKGPNVNAVAGTFGGGGHLLASGCQIQGEYEEVVDKVCFASSRELNDII